MQHVLQELDYAADPQRKAAYSLWPIVASATRWKLRRKKSINTWHEKLCHYPGKKNTAYQVNLFLATLISKKHVTHEQTIIQLTWWLTNKKTKADTSKLHFSIQYHFYENKSTLIQSIRRNFVRDQENEKAMHTSGKPGAIPIKTNHFSLESHL